MAANLPDLNIPATSQTPYVNYDKETSVLQITGRSIPEDVTSFYLPIIQWLQWMVNHSPQTFKFVLHLEYLNTHSTRALIDMLRITEQLLEKGKQVAVEWNYEEDDDEMREFSEDLSMMSSIPVTAKCLTEEEFDQKLLKVCKREER